MREQLKAVGLRIREARKAENLSQEKLAEALNISLSHMSDIENGKTNIGLEIFINLTETLQVSADWLLRSNVPVVNDMYRNELDELLKSCSAKELKAFMAILKEIRGLRGEC